jgi:hypothetical protein
MNNDKTPSLDTWLASYYACSEAREWASAYPDTAEGRQRAWNECPRGDWMLWIAGKLSGPVGSHARRLVVRCAVACARTSLHLIPGETDRAEIAAVLDALDAYALDSSAQTDLTALHRRAWDAQSKLRAAADAAADAAAAAAYAAAAAAYAAYYAAGGAYAAASAAAYAAAYAATYAASAARQAHLARCAQLVRELMPQPPG